MDARDLFYFAMFALWAFGQISRLVKGKAATPSSDQQLSLAEVAKLAADGLRHATEETRLVLARLDALAHDVLLSRLQPVLDRGDEVGAVLDDAGDDASATVPADLVQTIGESREIERVLGGLRHAMQLVARARQSPGMQDRYRVAEALVKSCWVPFAQSLLTQSIQWQRGVVRPPLQPLVVIDSVAHIAELRNLQLTQDLATVADTAQFVWFELARAIGVQVLTKMPEAQAEIYETIAPESDANVGSGADRMARVLLSSWLPSFLADAIGSQILGPTYLRALSRVVAMPAAPLRVVIVQIGNDGVVQATPPAHLRIHFVARWLSNCGAGTTATDLLLPKIVARRDDFGSSRSNAGFADSARAVITRAWDDAHGSPRALVLHGASSGAVELAPLFDAMMPMVDDIYRRPLAVFSGQRLAELPGFGVNRVSERQLRDIALDLARGGSVSAEVRVLAAAATEATLTAPNSRDAIDAALARVVDDSVRVERVVAVGKQPPRRASRRRATRAIRGVDPMQLVDAMLLHDIVLKRPQRPAGRTSPHVSA